MLHGICVSMMCVLLHTLCSQQYFSLQPCSPSQLCIWNVISHKRGNYKGLIHRKLMWREWGEHKEKSLIITVREGVGTMWESQCWHIPNYFASLLNIIIGFRPTLTPYYCNGGAKSCCSKNIWLFEYMNNSIHDLYYVDVELLTISSVKRGIKAILDFNLVNYQPISVGSLL